MSKDAFYNGKPPEQDRAGIDRREFLLAGTALAAAPLLGSSAGREPILDIHQHLYYQGRSNEQLIAHQRSNGVTVTNLMPGDGWLLSVVGGNADVVAFQAEHSGEFVRFACANPVEGRMFDLGGLALTGEMETAPPPASVLDVSGRRPSPFGLSWPSADVKLRAWGLGAKGPDAAIGIGEEKFHVPVDSPEMDQIYRLAEELDVPVLIHFEHRRYSLGIENLEKVLKRYPRVNFIGHAQTWWGNISADLNPLDYYPKGPIKPGGLIDRLLTEYPNLYGDLSAGSGLNAMTRDAEFARGFLDRHYRQLVWGSDCECRDGKGGGTRDGYCIGARCLAALRQLIPDPSKLRRVLYDNGAALLKVQQT
ncbi:MAG TPA: amidohydrolase [Terriglobia bacterium]|nr:amidohydrolase [Terriglobia bacterium]